MTELNHQLQETVEEIKDSKGKKNIIFDATLLTGLMTCGQFFDLRFNNQLGSVGGKSNSLETGSLLHKGLEMFYDNLIKGVPRIDAISYGYAAMEMYIKGCPYCTGFVPSENETKPQCGHPPNEYPGLQNTPPENTTKPNRTGWQWVLQTYVDYLDYYKNDHWVPLEVETVKRKPIYEDDEIRVLWKAKLDLTVDTNQGIFPIDHKTMKQNRPTSPLNNQFRGQCFVMGTRTMFVNKIGFQTTLEPKERFRRDPINYTSDILHEWQSEVVPYWAYQLVNYVESGMWPMNFTQCEGKFGPCMFSEVCKNNPSMRLDIIRNDFVVLPKWDVENVED